MNCIVLFLILATFAVKSTYSECELVPIELRGLQPLTEFWGTPPDFKTVVSEAVEGNNENISTRMENSATSPSAMCIQGRNNKEISFTFTKHISELSYGYSDITVMVISLRYTSKLASVQLFKDDISVNVPTASLSEEAELPNWSYFQAQLNHVDQVGLHGVVSSTGYFCLAEMNITVVACTNVVNQIQSYNSETEIELPEHKKNWSYILNSSPGPSPEPTLVITSTTTTTDSSSEPSTTDSTTEPSTTDLTTEPSTTDSTTEPSTTDLTTEPSTTDLTTEPSTTDLTTEPSTTDLTTEASTTDSTTEPSTTDVTTDSSTTDSTTEPSTTDLTTEPSTTDVTTDSSTTDSTTEPSTTDSTTEPSTTDSTTEPSTTDWTTEPSTTDSTTEPSTTDWTTEPSTTDLTTEPSTTDLTTEPSTTDSTTDLSTTSLNTEPSTVVSSTDFATSTTDSTTDPNTTEQSTIDSSTHFSTADPSTDSSTTDLSSTDSTTDSESISSQPTNKPGYETEDNSMSANEIVLYFIVPAIGLTITVVIVISLLYYGTHSAHTTISHTPLYFYSQNRHVNSSFNNSVLKQREHNNYFA